MLIADYLGTKVLDLIDEKFKEYINEKELQKILFRCFVEVGSREGEINGFNINKERIMNLESIKIQPNLSEGLLAKNLNSLFNECINIDDREKKEALKREICSAYISQARKKALELYHIQEVLEDINNNLDENNKELGEIKKYQLAQMKKNQGMLFFIDQLDESRAFIYLELEVAIEFRNNIDGYLCDVMQDVMNQSDVGFEYEFFVKDGMQCVAINFDEPTLQIDVKGLLECMNKIFSEENIKIYKITTYN